MHEIERKFLVTKPLREIIPHGVAANTRYIEQCYLGDTGEWTIRVRRYADIFGEFAGAVQTMKRKVTDRKCVELETQISDEHFETVASLCGAMLVKTRREIEHEGHIWHIDEFQQFGGLVVAEIELQDEDEEFAHPDWLGEEVTHKKRYKNRRMAQELESRS